MKLVSGSGNDFENGKPLEDDKINTIYVLDSDALPFHRAEVYHQFHDGACHDTGQHISEILTLLSVIASAVSHLRVCGICVGLIRTEYMFQQYSRSQCPSCGTPDTMGIPVYSAQQDTSFCLDCSLLLLSLYVASPPVIN